MFHFKFDLWNILEIVHLEYSTFIGISSSPKITIFFGCLHRSYDCTLNGGTPYEKGVEVDPAVSRTGEVVLLYGIFGC